MKIIENIQTNMIKYIISLILGVLTYLLLSVYADLLPNILPMLQGLPNTTIAKICIVAIILFVLSLVMTIVVYLQHRPTFKPKFGILWDKNKEPYCPSCKTYLSGYTENPPDGYYFWCHSHKDNVFIHNNGVPF